MTPAPATPPARPAWPRTAPPATRALFEMDAADAAFEAYVKTGNGDGPALLSARTSARAAYLRACRQDAECKQ